jgi:HK97 family phage major capsid protein
MSAEITKLIEEQGRAFEEFKRANQEAIATTSSDAKANAEKLANVVAELEAAKQQIERIEARGNASLSPAQNSAARNELKEAFRQWVRDGKENAVLELEKKSINITTAADGAVMLPREIEAEIAKTLTQISPVRSVVTTKTVSTSDYKKNVRTGLPAYRWVAESTDRSAATSAGAYAQRSPVWAGLECEPEVSNWAIQDFAYDVEADLLADITEAFAAGEGVGVVSGNGTTQIKGFLAYTTASTADGTRADNQLQYVATGQAAALSSYPLTAEILNVVKALKVGHRANAKFLFNQNVLGELMALKDSTNRPLWEPSLQANEPSLLVGYPVVICPDMPDVAANSYPIAFGDFQKGYYLVDRVGVSLLRNPYRTSGFVRFQVEKRIGGMVVDSEAIKLIKVAAS